MLPIRTLNTNEAATCLSLSRSRLAKLRWAGGGPKFIRVGRTVLYRVSDLENWLDAQTRKSTSSLQPVATNST
jgi:predicted DNA-binding transcriptional regulator AlpA